MFSPVANPCLQIHRRPGCERALATEHRERAGHPEVLDGQEIGVLLEALLERQLGD